VSTKKPDISQIKKYLQNELDARAMHQLERKAQDDSFLAEAMEGFEKAAPDQDANYVELQKRLAGRIEPAKERSIWLWRFLPIAACLLIALLIGYEYLSPKKQKQQLAEVVKAEPSTSRADTIKSLEEPVIPTPQKRLSTAKIKLNDLAEVAENKKAEPHQLIDITLVPSPPSITYKADTVEYKASEYRVRQNATVDDLLKHMEGFEVDSGGNVTHQGQTVTKARLNGRDYAGGDVQKAVKSLPADILEKIQVVDDYGDQAAKTGIKTGSPAKVLNLTTVDSSKMQLVARNRAAISSMQLNEVVVATPMGPVNIAVYAHPLIGDKAYKDYLNKNAVMPNGETGAVELGFMVEDDGTPQNIHIIASNNDALNAKAIELITKGSKWKKWSEASTEEAHIKIKFSKP